MLYVKLALIVIFGGLIIALAGFMVYLTGLFLYRAFKEPETSPLTNPKHYKRDLQIVKDREEFNDEK